MANRYVTMMILLTVVLMLFIHRHRYMYLEKVKRRRRIPAGVRIPIMDRLLRLVYTNATALHPFLIYGTLLGYVRERDFICYDFDVDIGVLDHEFDVMYARLAVACASSAEFNLKYVQLFAWRFMHLIHVPTGLNMDISPYRAHTSGGKWCLSRRVPYLYSRWYCGECSAALPFCNVLPLRRATLRGVDVYIPNEPHAVLKCHYGKNYLTPDMVCKDVANCAQCESTA